MIDFCDFCDAEAVDLFELSGNVGRLKYVYGCERHREIAEATAKAFAPASKGSLADEIRRADKTGERLV